MRNLFGREGGQYGITKNRATRTWYAWCLTDINQWSPCLRIDANVLASAKKHLLRSQLDRRLDTGDTKHVAYMSVFVVSLRKDAVDWINITNEVTGTMDQLSVDTDFMYNFNLNGGDISEIQSTRVKMYYTHTVSSDHTIPSWSGRR